MSTAEDLAREFAALNKATQKAHEAIAQLRQERALLREEREKVEALCKTMGTVTSMRATEILEAEVTRQFVPMVDEIATLLDNSRALVSKKFDEFADLLMGKEDASGKDLEAMVRQAAAGGKRI